MALEILILQIISIILIGLGISAVVIYFKLQKEKQKTDYLALFVFGIIWAAVSIFLQKYPLSILGILFMIIGLCKRKIWKKNKTNWEKMKKKEKSYQIILLIILVAVLTITYGVWKLKVILIGN